MIRPVQTPSATSEADALRVDPRRDPPRLLLVGPPGSGKSALCRARFAAALDAGGPGSALLLLPTYGEVEHEKRVAVSRRTPVSRSGGGPRGPRRVDGLFDEAYATFTSLGERALPDWRVGTLPSRIERDLLAGEALRRADVAAFREVRDRAGFRSRFLRLVKEMKQTGGDPAALRADARARRDALRSPAARERLDGFLRAWEAYDALLAQGGLWAEGGRLAEGGGLPAEGGAPRGDHEDALRALLLRLRSDPPPALAGLACLAVDGFDDLSGLEAELLLACVDAVGAGGGRVVMTLPFDPARASLYAPSEALIARLSDRSGFVVHTLPACRRSSDAAISALCHGLFAGGEGDPEEVPVDGGVRAIVGCDPADEVDRIGREVLRLVDPARTDLALREGASPVAFRDVAIVFRRLDDVGPWARRALEAMGVPARLVGTGAPLSGEAPVRALRGPLRLLAGDDGSAGGGSLGAVSLGGGRGARPFDAARLLDHARWTAVASGADPAPAADDVDRLDALWRSEGFPADWATMRAVCERSSRGLSAWVARLEAARLACVGASSFGPRAAFGAIEGAVHALLPLPEPSGFDAQGRPLDPAGDARLARARGAVSALTALAGELRRAHERTGLSPSLGASEAAEALLLAAREARFEPADRRLDAVALIDAEEARHWEVGVVFVAGLVEKSFPLHPREDVFLRDADRGALRGERDPGRGGAPTAAAAGPLFAAAGGALRPEPGPALRTAREGEDRERRLFLSAVTRARARVYLCRHASGEDGREKAPSFFWDEVARAVRVRDGERARRLGEDPPDLGRAHVPCAEAVCEGDLGAAVAAGLGTIAPAAGAEGVRRAAVALAREGGPEVAAWLARAARFRRTGADAPPPEAVPLFVRAVLEVSPSQVNDGLACRHRHFLRHVAGVPEDDLPLAGGEPDRRDVGTAIHAALCEAVRRRDASPAEVAATVLLASRDLRDSAVKDFLRTDLERIVALFREREAAGSAAKYDPLAGEFEFGRRTPHRVSLGGPVSAEGGRGALAGAPKDRACEPFDLRGKVDRVDLLAGASSGTAIVVDYKTSKSAVEDLHRATKNGTDVQLPLYALAVERVTGARVVGLELYAASVRGRRQIVDEGSVDALAPRAEGHDATTLEAGFRALLEDAEARASGLVAETRAAVASSLRREVADAEVCGACGWRGVCRPDETRVAVPRAFGEEPS